jgi:transcription initiation factor TFIIIB Brf1 subunit/transcription initiation factor TFIIB
MSYVYDGRETSPPFDVVCSRCNSWVHSEDLEYGSTMCITCAVITVYEGEDCGEWIE